MKLDHLLQPLEGKRLEFKRGKSSPVNIMKTLAGTSETLLPFFFNCVHLESTNNKKLLEPINNHGKILFERNLHRLP